MKRVVQGPAAHGLDLFRTQREALGEERVKEGLPVTFLKDLTKFWM